MKLLRLKHWELFLITFAIPLVIYLTGFFISVFRIVNKSMAPGGHNYQPQIADFVPVIIAAIIMFAGAVTHYVWMYNAATKLQQYMNPDMRKLKLKRFKIFFFSPFVYILLLGTLVPIIISYQVNQESPSPAVFILLFSIIIPGHLYSAFCLIYVLYFSAKTVKSAELQREAHFNDYIAEFFMFWFFPVGVWFLQPKINKVINGPDKEFESTEVLEQ